MTMIDTITTYLSILAFPTAFWLAMYLVPHIYMAVVRPVPDLKKRYRASQGEHKIGTPFSSEAEEEVVIVYKQGVKVPANVTKVIFDASVTEIPDGDDYKGVFSHCKQLKEVVLNHGLQKIGDWAFLGCTSLTIIKLPSTVTEVGESAFRLCKNLKEVELNDGLQKIEDGAFSNCTSLTIIKLPSTVTKVGEEAFCGCTNLGEVVLNEGLQKILECAFRGCESLTIIKLPSTVTEVGNCAFYKCTNLKEVELNDGLKKIGHWAFYKCTSLTIIKLPSTVTKIGIEAFRGCTNLGEAVLNEGLQKIGDCAFQGCESLTIIKLPSTVTKVGEEAFYGCTHLREFAFNEGLQEIGYGTFHDCASLTEVKFPSISKRAKNLIESGQTMDIEGKLLGYGNFEWRGGELVVSPEAIRNVNWAATRTNLEEVLAWISHHELEEATTLFNLALWKARIEEMGAVTDGERSVCRGGVLGPVKATILQYLQQTSND